MTSDELRKLADESERATCARLDVASGPDAARLLADAMDALQPHTRYCEALHACTCGGSADVEQLLARFAALGEPS